MRRFNVEVDDQTLKRLQKMPRGFRSQVVRKFLARACDAYERNGLPALGLLIEGEYDLVPRLSEPPKNGPRTGRPRR